jgi:mRNA interferase MazF
VEIKRGEIWFVSLNPVVGDEAAKTRPCVILQNDLGNRHSQKTIVAPLLEPQNYPFVVNIAPTKLNNLDRKRGLDLSHIRSISLKRIQNKLGVMENKYWSEIEKAVRIQLGFDEIFD